MGRQPRQPGVGGVQNSVKSSGQKRSINIREYSKRQWSGCQSEQVLRPQCDGCVYAVVETRPLAQPHRRRHQE